MKKAASFAATRAIRTFAQTAAAGLGVLAIATLTTQDLRIAAATAGLALANAGIAGIVSFLQNFAEQLPE